jgi:hypothetical protein
VTNALNHVSPVQCSPGKQSYSFKGSPPVPTRSIIKVLINPYHLYIYRSSPTKTPDLRPGYLVKMDSLVAKYTQPVHEDEGYSHEEQMELLETTPSLDLRFALPPVAQVRPSASTYALLYTVLRILELF